VTAAELQRYLHEHIPLSLAMGTVVLDLGPDSVTLAAPLAPNINHRATAFGGSVAALGMLAAWSLLHTRLRAAQAATDGAPVRLVVQRSEIRYERPIPGDFRARARLADPDDWQRFLAVLERRGRARIAVEAVLECAGEDCASMSGEFVAARAMPA
jgi:thioesterase domain-containing protein